MRAYERHTCPRTAEEVHVGKQLALDEVFIAERDLLQFHTQLEHFVIFDAKLGEHVVAHTLQDHGTRIVVLVHAMAKAHQPEGVLLVLRASDKFRYALLQRHRGVICEVLTSG